MRTQLTKPNEGNIKSLGDCNSVAHMDQREYRIFLALQNKDKVAQDVYKKKFWQFW